jgi:hypothetical protein
MSYTDAKEEGPLIELIIYIPFQPCHCVNTNAGILVPVSEHGYFVAS